MKERWDLNRRAVRLLYHLDRKYFLCTLFSSLTTAIAPYIPIYFSAKIIDALTAGAGGKTLALYAALTVGLTWTSATSADRKSSTTSTANTVRTMWRRSLPLVRLQPVALSVMWDVSWICPMP